MKSKTKDKSTPMDQFKEGKKLFESGDLKEGFKLLVESKNNSCLEAYYFLGKAYFDGDKIKRDIDKSYIYLLKVYNSSKDISLKYIKKIIYSGFLNIHEKRKILKLIKKGAKQGKKREQKFLAEYYSRNPFKIWNYYRGIYWYSKLNKTNRYNFITYIYNEIKFFFKGSFKQKRAKLGKIIKLSLILFFVYVIYNFSYSRIRDGVVLPMYKRIKFTRKETENLVLYAAEEYEGEDIGDFQRIYEEMKEYYIQLGLIDDLDFKPVETIMLSTEESNWMEDSTHAVASGKVRTVILKNYYYPDYIEEKGPQYPGYTAELFKHELGHIFFHRGITKKYNVNKSLENNANLYENFNETLSRFVQNIKYKDGYKSYEIHLSYPALVDYNDLSLSEYIVKMENFNYNHISINSFGLFYFYLIKSYGEKAFQKYVRLSLETGNLKTALERSTNRDIEDLSEEFLVWNRRIRKNDRYKDSLYLYIDF